MTRDDAMSTPAAPGQNHNHNHGEPRGLFGRVTDTVTNRALDTLHPDLILDHVDVNAIVERIDIEELLGRVDLDQLLERIDVDKLLDRIDVQRLLDRIDVQQLVGRSGIPDIVRESTGQVAGSALDVARRQVVGLDFVIERLVDRLMRRDRSRFPSTPPLLREEAM